MTAGPRASGDWFADGPDRARILVSGEATGRVWSLMEWEIAPAATLGAPGLGPHRHHRCEETFIIRSGSLDFLLGETLFHLEAGDTIRAAAGVRHGFANVSDAKVELLVSFLPPGSRRCSRFIEPNREGSPSGDGFIADATRLHASEYEAS